MHTYLGCDVWSARQARPKRLPLVPDVGVELQVPQLLQAAGEALQRVKAMCELQRSTAPELCTRESTAAWTSAVSSRSLNPALDEGT